MRWFKFYGQDWLTDMKIRQMSPEDKLCYITLLCLASASDEQGLIRNCSEEEIITLTGLYYNPYDDDNPYTRAQGCLKRYEALRCVTLSDNGDVILLAFNKRQNENLSNAERQKKYRERHKMAKKKSNGSNVTQCNDSNARIEENRIDISEANASAISKDMDWNRKSDDFEEGVVDLDGDISLTEEKKEPTKKYPNAPAVRKVFLKVLGLSPANWKVNTTQLKACENLFTERTLEKVESALLFYKEHEDDEFCPKITSPFDLDSKWTKLGAYKLKVEK